MDATTPVLIGGLLLMGFVSEVIWASLRLGAMLMVAPIVGTRALPGRIRLIVALSLSCVVAPLIESPPLTQFDGRTIVAIITEMAIGMSMGFTLRVAFEAAALAGELVAQGMALSFAQLADPLRGGATSGVVGMWFYIGFALLFLAFDGHLAMLRMIIDSYNLVPIGGSVPDPVKMVSGAPRFLAIALITGVQIALPLMMAMVVVNLAFGVLGRAAPALNPIAVGLPAALTVGMLLMAVLVTELTEPARLLFDQAFNAAASLLE
ncbi:flagellar biosynthetic protein FliR [Pseudomarimonas arenosa]|uniref:Flagellar biosynthetic protein FliR n=1 Tax=Pseudomarimonas arenosa TaxID=2774145 RepID=A0AAW3ZJ34_9GAMM|nr:flagellar biosynthetic protein FliR [Pseudomarimonas arenosa]MBD8524729.1 flagellar biosynthetic protein FliR [Pseudomarimonas arenosa]